MIEFELSNISISGFDTQKIREWVKSVIIKEKAKPGAIQFIIINDEEMLELNNTYLKHDTLTDIITFNYNTELGGISGDIYISHDRVLENAEQYNVSEFNELLRVMVHGVLHLIGYDDHDDSSMRRMRDRENYYLSLFDF